LIIGENVELGIQVRISKPSEVGSDRLPMAPGSKLSMIFTLLTAS
jgi:pantothenate kinase type III